MYFLTMKLPGITDTKSKKTGAKRLLLHWIELDGLDYQNLSSCLTPLLMLKETGPPYDLLNLNIRPVKEKNYTTFN